MTSRLGIEKSLSFFTVYSVRAGRTIGGFNVSNLMGIKRRMIDIGKKITFYFLQNVWKCTVFFAFAFKEKNILGHNSTFCILLMQMRKNCTFSIILQKVKSYFFGNIYQSPFDSYWNSKKSIKLKPPSVQLLPSAVQAGITLITGINRGGRRGFHLVFQFVEHNWDTFQMYYNFIWHSK